MEDWEDIVTRALLEIGVVEGSETPESHLIDEGIKQAKEMLEQWSIEGLLNVGTKETTYTIPANATSKLLIEEGTAAVDTDGLPLRFVDVAFKSDGDNSYSYSLNRLDGDNFFASNFQRDEEEGNPTFYYYDITKENGGEMLFDLKLPEGGELKFIYRPILDTAITKTTNFNLPIGYKAAVRLNLAVWMASSAGIESGNLSAITIHNARQTKTQLPKLNWSKQGQTKLERAALQNGRRSGWTSYGRWNRSFEEYR